MKSNLELTIQIRLNTVDEIPEMTTVLPKPQSDGGGENQSNGQDPRPPLSQLLAYDVRPFKFTPARAVVDFPFNWKVLVRVLGGSPSSLVWLPATKSDTGEQEAYLRPSPQLNPFQPRTPGARGFVVGSIQQELSAAGIKIKKLPLFLTGSCTSYAGTYTWQDVEPLSYVDWSRLSESFKQKSIELFLTQKQRLVQIKVARWKVDGHWPSDAEVDGKANYSTVGKSDIARAIEANVLRVPLSAVQCIGYDYKFVRELIRKAEHHPPNGSAAALLDQDATKLRTEPKEANHSMNLHAGETSGTQLNTAESGRLLRTRNATNRSQPTSSLPSSLAQSSTEKKRRAIPDLGDDVQEVAATRTIMKVGPPRKKFRQTVEVVIPTWPKRDHKAISTLNENTSRISARDIGSFSRMCNSKRLGVVDEGRQESPEV